MTRTWFKRIAAQAKAMRARWAKPVSAPTDLRALDPDPVRARSLVLDARAVIAEHAKFAWSYTIDVVDGVTPYKTLCGCAECERLTPIARILLPEEQASRSYQGAR